MKTTAASPERDVFQMENPARRPATGSGADLQAKDAYAVYPRVFGNARRHVLFARVHGDAILTMEAPRSFAMPSALLCDAHGGGDEGNFTPLPPLEQKIHSPWWNIVRVGRTDPETPGILDIDDVTISRVFEEALTILDESWVKVSVEADRRLRELRELELGWDGCDGVPIPEEVIGTTERVLIEFRDLVVSQFGNPYISPLSDGGVDLEWESVSGAELLLTIHSPEAITYLLDIPTGDGRVEESEGRVPQDSTVVDLFSKFT